MLPAVAFTPAEGEPSRAVRSTPARSAGCHTTTFAERDLSVTRHNARGDSVLVLTFGPLT
jgi:hypothetical protein